MVGIEYATLTVQQVARELDRSLEQVRRYIREGKLPARKVGLQWFVDRSALRTFRKNESAPEENDPIERAGRLRKQIFARAGLFDAVQLLERSRARLDTQDG